MRKILLVCLTALFILFLFNCGKEKAAISHNPWDADRPHDPWVFRSVLDTQARMVTLALHDDLWVAYSADQGALYKAWKGNVNFDGAVYTTVHGPQPTSYGDAYFINKYKSPWVIVENGQERKVKSHYKGHRFEGNGVELLYEIDLDNGQVIKVREHPEYVTSGSGQSGFERVYTTSGVPDGIRLGMMTNVSSIAMAEQLKTDGTLEVQHTQAREKGNIQAVDLDARLLLNSNATTTLSCWFVKTPMIENPNKMGEDESNQPQGFQLIAQNDCKTCHNTYRKTIGPAYVDVAKKYRNTPENISLLSGKVKAGGSGVWGEQVMNAHPEVSEEDIKTMVTYIMELDAEEEATLSNLPEENLEGVDLSPATSDLTEADLFPGAIVKVYTHTVSLKKLADINLKKAPVSAGIVPSIKMEGGDFQGLENDFAFVISGYLKIPQSRQYEFSISSDDGSRLSIDNKVLIDHDGLHGTSHKDGKVALAEGYHPFLLEYFQGKGGKSLAFEWKAPGETQFSTVPATVLVHHKKDKPSGIAILSMASERRIPGDGFPLTEVHPSYDLSQARPDIFTPKVGGIDFLSDGRMVVSTWDAAGSVFILSGVESGDPTQIEAKTIAKGFAEPLGLKVVDDEIYVLQKQELTKLVDRDGDEIADEYQTVSNNWLVSANFHEFAFGLAYKEGYFYATLATAIMPGGASAVPQIPDRGKVLKISKADGSVEFLAHGLRTPNGIGIGVDNEIFVADNQGDWLPASKIVHVKKGAWFGSHSVDPEGTANLQETLPVVWLPQDEIGNSPSTPLALNDGPYKGQMIHGEVTNGGVKRVFVEKVNGEYQGCVFRFIQGLEAGINRLCWGPDGALYVGGIGSTGNWGHTGKLWYGLQRLKYNEKSTFEMLAVRAKSNGMEIEFTEPLREGEGFTAADYLVKQWYYLPTKEYGGPKMEEEALQPIAVNVSEDRKRVFLELAGMKPNHVVYLQIQNNPISANGHQLWSSEAWYTLNTIPENTPGFKRTPPAPQAVNTLSEAEKEAGWALLFDGQSTKGWRNFKKQTIGKSWIIDDNALMLNAQQKDNGGWQAADGGDIITEGEYDNYELSLEWKIGNCGNSGVIYNVNESEDYEYVWQTGPEMQVLDNSCHPDAKIVKHRAGDLYDMIECKYVTVLPAGAWNRARLIVNKGKVEHWLNGCKVVEYTLWDDTWNNMVKNSKFGEMKGFGTFKKGHISLQDHGDPVWYRNIKIRDLNKES